MSTAKQFKKCENIHLGLLDPEDKGTYSLQNIDNYLSFNLLKSVQTGSLIHEGRVLGVILSGLKRQVV
jgi:hypothetical protein